MDDEMTRLPVFGFNGKIAQEGEFDLENLGDMIGIVRGWQQKLEIRLCYDKLPPGVREAIETNMEPLWIEAETKSYLLDMPIPREAELMIEVDGAPFAVSHGQLTKHDFDETTSMVSWRFEGAVPEVLYPTKKETR
jgi:hypothetical protein